MYDPMMLILKRLSCCLTVAAADKILFDECSATLLPLFASRKDETMVV